ncbi:transposase [Novosphingobium sp. PY1]|nr:transposase [Novosphingobium sp. PY1]
MRQWTSRSGTSLHEATRILIRFVALHMGLIVRTVGIKRAEMKVGLANLVFKIRRFLYLKRVNAI